MSCDLISLAAPGVRELSPYLPGKPESELRREYGLEEVIKLASNENPLGPSPRAVAAVAACLDGVARYPDGNAFELKAALAERHGVEPVQITLGNGSNDVLELIARGFLTPAHEAVFSAHAFAVYPIVTQAVGARARVATALPVGHPMAYGHDLDAMRGQIGDATRVVFVANPNNPTGTWLEADALEAFVADVPGHAIVVVDEAYFEYGSGTGCPDASQWLSRYPNLVVTRTFSKAYGLAGLRVGYALSHPQVADVLNRVRQPFNVSIPAQVGALAALSDTAYLSEARALNARGMQQLTSGLAGLGIKCLPSVGNFVCAGLDRPGREVFQALLPEGVILRPVDNYGMPNFLRISIGTERENARCLEALARVLGR